MKYVTEYRDPALAGRLLAAIRAKCARPHAIMEICGGQTHAILRHGLDQLLAPQVRLLHGPGCPVCVTPAAVIDHAVAIALTPGVILCSFGDMLRVPGSTRSLQAARAEGGSVRILYSPLDALSVARSNPESQVVFLAIGFETTAPVNASLVLQARHLGISNLTLLVSQSLVAPAMQAILQSDDCQVEAFLAAGHVATVTGWSCYERIASRYHVPIVVTGFEPIDILDGVLGAVSQLESGVAVPENRYARAVQRNGNQHARQMIAQVFEVCDRDWRGIGIIPSSGLRLRHEFSAFDAARRFPMPDIAFVPPSPCIAGAVLQGRRRPDECAAFGHLCTPGHPLGAPMVSTEGACAAWYSYARKQ